MDHTFVNSFILITCIDCSFMPIIFQITFNTSRFVSANTLDTDSILENIEFYLSYIFLGQRTWNYYLLAESGPVGDFIKPDDIYKTNEYLKYDNKKKFQFRKQNNLSSSKEILKCYIQSLLEASALFFPLIGWLTQY